MLSMDQGIILYRETPLPLALRGFIAFIGISCGLGIPAAWLANASLSMPLPALALLAVVVVVCPGFCVVLVGLALVSTTELRIDPALDSVTRTRRGPLLNDVNHFPRHGIGPPVVTMRDAEDGPFPVLRLPLQRGKWIEMASFSSRDEADLWRDRIAAALAA